MERILYRKTLDVHKNGVQFILQGFETGDKLSRTIEISLMASGDAIDFPLEQVVALMYVTTPNASQPSINECVIKDNKVIYDVLPITEEGVSTMQLKLIEATVDGADSVLCSPKFAVEVLASSTNDGPAMQTTSFTALETAVGKAKEVYDKRLERVEVDDKCIFRAYYADGAVYETDAIMHCLMTGHTLLSKSYAIGDSGAREGEELDNSKYYSNVARSSSEEARIDGDHATELLEEVRKHGVYTSFVMDFDSGELRYVSPTYSFEVDEESGELIAKGDIYNFQEVLKEAVDKSYDELVEGLGQAKYTSDLMVNYVTPTFVKWDAATLNTPYKSGITTSHDGFALVYGDISGDHNISAWGAGNDGGSYIHTISNGVDKGWSYIKFTNDGEGENVGNELSGYYVGLNSGRGKMRASNIDVKLETDGGNDNSGNARLRYLTLANQSNVSKDLANAITMTNIEGGHRDEYTIFGTHNAASLLPQYVTPLIPELPKITNLEVETGTWHGDGKWTYGEYFTLKSKKGLKPMVVIVTSMHDSVVFIRDSLVSVGQNNGAFTRFTVRWDEDSMGFFNSYYFNGTANGSGNGNGYYSLNYTGVNYYYLMLGTKEE